MAHRHPPYRAPLALLLTFLLVGCGGGSLPTTPAGSGGSSAAGSATTSSSAAAASSAASAGAAPHITLVDTNSGANFQQWFTKWFVPQAEKALNVKIDYVTSTGAESLQRLKAMQDGKGDFDIVFLKDNDLANMVKQGIKFEQLYPNHKADIPNIDKTPIEDEKVVVGVDVNYAGALFWRSQGATIVDTAKLPKPPASWKELYDRRQELKGHIAMVRPDAKSGGGRTYMYTFFHAMGVKFEGPDGKPAPLDQLMQTPEWKEAAQKFSELSTCMVKPLAAEPPNMFQTFVEGTAWISDYAQDYSIWASTQGLLPPTMKAYPMAEGEAISADGHMAIPSNLPAERKPNAFKLLNYMLSDEVQLNLLTQMYQYPGTDAWKRAPADAYKKIPPFEEARKPLFPIKNNDAYTWFQQHGMELVK